MVLLFSLWLLAGEGAIYGQPVKAETPIVSIEKLTANPEAYLDKVVKVKGKVDAVCPMAGCWMDITDKKSKIRVKVKDGEIVFKQDAVGKQVIAEGTVYKFELTKEQAVGYFQHLAEEVGEAFDPASVTSGTTIYQIGGIGARVF